MGEDRNETVKISKAMIIYDSITLNIGKISKKMIIYDSITLTVG